MSIKIEDLNNKRILILLPNHIGDAIFSLAAIDGLKKRYPKCKIDVLINKAAKEVFESDPRINHIIPIDAWWESFWLKHGFYRWQKSNVIKRILLYLIPFLKLVFDPQLSYVRKKNFPLAINFDGNLFSNYFTFLTGAKERIGFNSPLSQILLTRRVLPKKSQHQVDKCIDLVRLLGGKRGVMKIYLSKDDKSYAKHVIKQCKKRKIIGIHPGASKVSRYKLLADTAWISIINKLQKKYAVLLFGTQHEVNIIKKILKGIRNSKNVFNLFQKTTLMQMTAIIKHCNVFIGLDSAPVHIAAAVNIPVVVLWTNYQNPLIWGPYTTEKVILKKPNTDNFNSSIVLNAVELLITKNFSHKNL